MLTNFSRWTVILSIPGAVASVLALVGGIVLRGNTPACHQNNLRAWWPKRQAVPAGGETGAAHSSMPSLRRSLGVAGP